MGTIERQVNISKSKKRWLSVEHSGNNHQIEIAHTTEQLEEAKALDDLVFDGHVGISMEELHEIAGSGAVLLMRDRERNLIGESQVITQPISEHPHLASDEAYNYGTAIHPKLQGQGFAQILYKAQETVAHEAGKQRSTLTVRLENAKSVRARLKANFKVVGYDPNHYGPVEEGGARLIMEKRLDDQYVAIPPSLLAKMVCDGEISLANPDNIDEKTQLSKPIGVGIEAGNKIDNNAHALVKQIFNAGNYQGVGILKPTEFDVNSRVSLLIFNHI